MYKKTKLFTLRTITPTHPGTGEGLGIIDLPIQREKHTNFPKIEGSSLKGAFREAWENVTDDFLKVHRILGIDEDTPGYTHFKEELRSKLGFKKDESLSISGAVAFSDAMPLLFPVKSVKGVFAFVTSPLALSKFADILKLWDKDNENTPLIENLSLLESSFSDDKLELFGVEETKLKINDKVVLEDLTFDLSFDYSAEIESFGKFVSKIFEVNEAIKSKLLTDIVIVPNNIFVNFVTEGTEVITRTKIDNEKGTVKEGALWTEEYLPAETFMISALFINNEFSKNKDEQLSASQIEEVIDEVVNNKLNNTLTLGGNTTIGKGVIKIKTY